ncbi:MAG: hypothetical protein R3B96_20030 [Pirellulaceae bacterium]
MDCSFTVRADSQPVPNAVVIAIPNRPRTDNDWELPYYFGQTDDESRSVGFRSRGLRHATRRLRSMGGGAIGCEVRASRFDLANVTYSTRRVTLVSSAVTPRFDLKHGSVRALRNIEIADGEWASWLPVGSLVPGLESVQRGQP